MVPAADLQRGAPEFFFDPEIACFARCDEAAIVGEIRIDNGADLSRLLGDDRAGVDSDAELFLRAFLRWGADCLDRVEGDFAVALWDAREQRLYLARDALGQRPLHYRRVGKGIAFGSLPIALAALTQAPRADLVQIAAWLQFMPQLSGRSFIEGVNCVQAGHVVICRNEGTVEERRWWQPDLSPLGLGHGQAAEAVAAELERTLRAHVRTDAPAIAADLSGGLDSSLIVSLATGVPGARDRLVALTAVAGEPRDHPPGMFIDEAERAAETARINGVDHRIVIAPPESPFDGLDRSFATMQEPTLNACNLGWLDACFDAARTAGAKVYLTGGRGNFTVTRPGLGRFEELATGGRWIELARELRRYRAFAGGSWSGLLAMSFAPWIPDAVWNMLAPVANRRSNSHDPAMLSLLRDGSATRAADDHRQTMGGAIARTLFAEENPEARWKVARSIDEGAGNLSIRRRYGLELREPLAARRLVELCIRLPAATYLHDGRPRALGRELLRGRAPDCVVEERQRGWQGANWRFGFESAREEMRREIDRIGGDAELSALLNADRMLALLDDWPASGWDKWEQIQMYRNTLFPAIGAARFARFVREWPESAAGA